MNLLRNLDVLDNVDLLYHVLLYSTLTASLMPVQCSFLLFGILMDLQFRPLNLLIFRILRRFLDSLASNLKPTPIFTCPLRPSPSQCLGPLSAPDPEDPPPASPPPPPPPPPADSLPLTSRSRFSRSYRSLSCELW